jgi:hypothetical protein
MELLEKGPYFPGLARHVRSQGYLQPTFRSVRTLIFEFVDGRPMESNKEGYQVVEMTRTYVLY